MEKKTVEHNELIATRVPPGDRWSLQGDSRKEVFSNLTDTLEAFYHQTGFTGAYRLDPLDSKLYAIQTSKIEVKKEKPKVYGMYGEFRQGI
tara:strand:- start:455 stop:727 length:273 start_codon:yes stop_codon:yes gene_type:complete